MQFCVETPRLLFRQFTMQDAGLVLTLNADSEVVRFTHDRMRDIVHAEEVLEKIILPQYKSYGVGRWAVYLKSNSEFMGWCGLKFIAERNEYDLGYRYLSAFWGKGYATEAAMACLQFGFEIRNLERIVGRAMPEKHGFTKGIGKMRDAVYRY